MFSFALDLGSNLQGSLHAMDDDMEATQQYMPESLLYFSIYIFMLTSVIAQAKDFVFISNLLWLSNPEALLRMMSSSRQKLQVLQLHQSQSPVIFIKVFTTLGGNDGL